MTFYLLRMIADGIIYDNMRVVTYRLGIKIYRNRSRRSLGLTPSPYIHRQSMEEV